MVKCYYDLHIHTALSPCGDKDMTPNNIVNMALLKKLDIIAITDHNSCKNVEPVLKAASKTNLIVVPGIEVETFEGIHMLCYFKSLTDLKDFTSIIDDNLPDIENNEVKWGSQLILNENDDISGTERKMLINSTNIKINELVKLVHIYNGRIVASHIDKYANSILTVLGFIPDDLPLDGIEVSLNANLKEYETIFKYRIFQNSDAHFLADICEKNNNIILLDKSLEAFFHYLGDKDA